ncbi:hypothetical protein HYU06_00245, partial [Candidatus Woesearchaeota archaeon]|nr:hypothetical protein [Candidatus Woesearchaeota archaeon]
EAIANDPRLKNNQAAKDRAKQISDKLFVDLYSIGRGKENGVLTALNTGEILAYVTETLMPKLKLDSSNAEEVLPKVVEEMLVAVEHLNFYLENAQKHKIPVSGNNVGELIQATAQIKADTYDLIISKAEELSANGKYLEAKTLLDAAISEIPKEKTKQDDLDKGFKAKAETLSEKLTPLGIVKQGIEDFKAGRYEKAARAFEFYLQSGDATVKDMDQWLVKANARAKLTELGIFIATIEGGKAIVDGRKVEFTSPAELRGKAIDALVYRKVDMKFAKGKCDGCSFIEVKYANGQTEIIQITGTAAEVDNALKQIEAERAEKRVKEAEAEEAALEREAPREEGSLTLASSTVGLGRIVEESPEFRKTLIEKYRKLNLENQGRVGDQRTVDEKIAALSEFSNREIMGRVTKEWGDVLAVEAQKLGYDTTTGSYYNYLIDQVYLEHKAGFDSLLATRKAKQETLVPAGGIKQAMETREKAGTAAQATIQQPSAINNRVASKVNPNQLLTKLQQQISERLKGKELTPEQKNAVIRNEVNNLPLSGLQKNRLSQKLIEKPELILAKCGSPCSLAARQKIVDEISSVIDAPQIDTAANAVQQLSRKNDIAAENARRVLENIMNDRVSATQIPSQLALANDLLQNIDTQQAADLKQAANDIATQQIIKASGIKVDMANPLNTFIAQDKKLIGTKLKINPTPIIGGINAESVEIIESGTGTYNLRFYDNTGEIRGTDKLYVNIKLEDLNKFTFKDASLKPKIDAVLDQKATVIAAVTANIDNRIIIDGKSVTAEELERVDKRLREKGLPDAEVKEIMRPLVEASVKNSDAVKSLQTTIEGIKNPDIKAAAKKALDAGIAGFVEDQLNAENREVRYHSIEHWNNVVNDVKAKMDLFYQNNEYAGLVSEHDRELDFLAALAHDVGYVELKGFEGLREASSTIATGHELRGQKFVDSIALSSLDREAIDFRIEATVFREDKARARPRDYVYLTDIAYAATTGKELTAEQKQLLTDTTAKPTLIERVRGPENNRLAPQFAAVLDKIKTNIDNKKAINEGLTAEDLAAMNKLFAASIGARALGQADVGYTAKEDLALAALLRQEFENDLILTAKQLGKLGVKIDTSKPTAEIIAQLRGILYKTGPFNLKSVIEMQQIFVEQGLSTEDALKAATELDNARGWVTTWQPTMAKFLAGSLGFQQFFGQPRVKQFSGDTITEKDSKGNVIFEYNSLVKVEVPQEHAAGQLANQQVFAQFDKVFNKAEVLTDAEITDIETKLGNSGLDNQVVNEITNELDAQNLENIKNTNEQKARAESPQEIVASSSTLTQMPESTLLTLHITTQAELDVATKQAEVTAGKSFVARIQEKINAVFNRYIGSYEQLSDYIDTFTDFAPDSVLWLGDHLPFIAPAIDGIRESLGTNKLVNELITELTSKGQTVQDLQDLINKELENKLKDDKILREGLAKDSALNHEEKLALIEQIMKETVESIIKDQGLITGKFDKKVLDNFLNAVSRSSTEDFKEDKLMLKLRSLTKIHVYETVKEKLLSMRWSVPVVINLVTQALGIPSDIPYDPSRKDGKLSVEDVTSAANLAFVTVLESFAKALADLKLSGLISRAKAAKDIISAAKNKIISQTVQAQADAAQEAAEAGKKIAAKIEELTTASHAENAKDNVDNVKFEMEQANQETERFVDANKEIKEISQGCSDCLVILGRMRAKIALATSVYQDAQAEADIGKKNDLMVKAKAQIESAIKEVSYEMDNKLVYELSLGNIEAVKAIGEGADLGEAILQIDKTIKALDNLKTAYPDLKNLQQLQNSIGRYKSALELASDVRSAVGQNSLDKLLEKETAEDRQDRLKRLSEATPKGAVNSFLEALFGITPHTIKTSSAFIGIMCLTYTTPECEKVKAEQRRYLGQFEAAKKKIEQASLNQNMKDLLIAEIKDGRLPPIKLDDAMLAAIAKAKDEDEARKVIDESAAVDDAVAEDVIGSESAVDEDPIGTALIGSKEEKPEEIQEIQSAPSDEAVQLTPRQLGINKAKELIEKGIIRSFNNFEVGDDGIIRIIDYSQDIIAGVTLTPDVDDIEIALFLDGEKHPEIRTAYLSVDAENKKLFFHTTRQRTTIKLELSKDNPFIKLEDTDTIDFSVGDRINIGIQNRDAENLIPLILLEQTPNSLVSITSGGVNAGIRNENINLFNSFMRTTSSPMAILLTKDVNYNGLNEPNEVFKKVIISNYNEILEVPVDAKEGIKAYDPVKDTPPAKISERLDFNYNQFTEEAVEQKYNLELTGSITPTVAKRLADTLDHMPPAIRESVNGFKIYTRDEWNSDPRNSGVAGFATGEGVVRLPIDIESENIIYHELAHELTSKLEKENEQAFSQQFYDLKRKKGIDKLQVSYVRVLPGGGRFYFDVPCEGCPLEVLAYKEGIAGLRASEFIKLSPKEEEQIKQTYLQIQKDSFTAKWREASGNINYGQNLGKRNVGGQNSANWADGTSDAKEGVVRAYGANNYMEDIATYMENIYRNPDFYKPLITPPGQAGHDAAAYDPRYRKKLDLLYENGFITGERYGVITESVDNPAPSGVTDAKTELPAEAGT